MLQKENAIRIDKAISYHNRKGKRLGSSYKVYIFNCEKCKSELRVQGQFVPKHSGLCVKCAQFGPPFISAYNSLLKSSRERNFNVSISYNDFLEFTIINNCHYCNSSIVWSPHTNKVPGNQKEARSYKLDRKDCSKGYFADNCVVCCWRCNSSKGNRYSYDEWYGMTEYFRK